MRRPSRAALAVLTATMTVAGAVSILGLIGGIRDIARRGLERLGENVIFVVAGGDAFGVGAARFTLDHVRALDELYAPAGGAQPIAVERCALVRPDGSMHSVLGVATNARTLYYFNYSVTRGRYFTDGEVRGDEPMCVLEWLLASSVHPDDPARCLGEVLAFRIGGVERRVEVIGLLEEPLTENAGELIGQPEVYHRVFMPFGLMPGGGEVFTSMAVKLPAGVSSDDAPDRITAALEAEGVPPDSFEFIDAKEETEMIRTSVLTLTSLGVAMTATCLLAESVAITSIILMSMTERIKEIGIRRAEGASRRDISVQFLFETLCIGAVGGALGVPVGMLGARILAEYAVDWPVSHNPLILLGAAAASAVVGMFSGLLPARHAASLDPVAALEAA